MDAPVLAAAILERRWTWSLAGVNAGLRALGLGFERHGPECFEYIGPGGLAATLRCAANGDPECIAALLRRSREPDDCDESGWDAEVDAFDRGFLDAARALALRIGDPGFLGRPPRGRTWDSWASQVAVWPQRPPAPTTWLGLQLRQDDTDLPIEIVLVWTPPGRWPVAFQPAPIPPPRAAAPEPGRAPSAEGFLRDEHARAVQIGKQGRLDEAIGILSFVTRSAPFWGLPWNDLGMALVLKGDIDAGVACFDRALEEDPALLALAARNRIEALVRAGRMGPRYAQLTAAANDGTATAPMLYELSLVLERQGHPQLVRQVVRRFLAVATPEYGEVVDKARAWIAGQPKP